MNFEVITEYTEQKLNYTPAKPSDPNKHMPPFLTYAFFYHSLRMCHIYQKYLIITSNARNR